MLETQVWLCGMAAGERKALQQLNVGFPEQTGLIMFAMALADLPPDVQGDTYLLFVFVSAWEAAYLNVFHPRYSVTVDPSGMSDRRARVAEGDVDAR